MALAVLLCLISSPLAIFATERAVNPRLTAFVHVNLITMEDERVLENQTVIVADGRIQKIGTAASVKIPRGARRIDGRSKFLLPGLADMHIHILDKVDFLLYLANGVTTVRNMSGEPFHLDWRRQIASGQLLAPMFYTSGPIMESGSEEGSNIAIVKTREEAERSVEAQKRAGYDFIKAYSGLTPEAFAGIVNAAKRLGLAVTGHGVRSIKLEDQLKAGQTSIDHAEEYIYTFFNFKTDDDSQIPYIARATRAAGTAVTPTLVTYDYITKQIGDIDLLMKKPELQYLDASIVRAWGPERNSYRRRIKPDQVPKFQQRLAFQRRLVTALHDAGVRILAGSDAGGYGGSVPFVIPGFSLHEELQNLVACGLSPLEAISAATRNAAETLGKLSEFGTISVGKRADLLLTDANPLHDVTALKRLAGVMVRGEWLTAAQLQSSLADLPALYRRESEFSQAVLQNGAQAAIARYRQQKKRTSQLSFFRESMMNSLGYRLLEEKKIGDALVVFALNAEAYPHSADVYDSLGEACMLSGDKAVAIRHYERSLRLNPANQNAVAMLEKLRKKQ